MRLPNFLSFGAKKRATAKPLYLFNTLTKEKEIFKPLSPRYVKMYSCGPTVYDYQTVGNLRPPVMANVLRRTLVYNGYAVKQVTNITDMGQLVSDADEGEDKMTRGLRREGKEITLKNMKALGTKYMKVFLKDLKLLNIDTEKITFPRASDYIGEQIALTQALDEKGYVYKTSDGMYFDISKHATYGALGNINLQGLKEGARVETNKEKKDHADFALWKFNENLGWDSPWGKGFPGWHIECTAMIFAELGKQIDIHTGGIDLIPTHHNNEIAQAESASGKSPHVKYWLHNAHISIEGQKISKSIGNTIYLRNIIEKEFNPLAYRYWLLTSHYRSPVNFTWQALEGAQTALTRMHKLFIEKLGEKNGDVVTTYQKKFHAAVNDDLDTPQAIALMWELVKDEKIRKANKRATLLNFDAVLGLGLIEGSRKLKAMLRSEEKRVKITKAPEEVAQLLAARTAARAEKNWDEADRLRKEIEKQGYKIEDTTSTSTLKKQ